MNVPAEKQENVSFINFGKTYQEKVIQAIIEDKDFAEQMIEVLDVTFFDQKYMRIVVDYYFNHYKQYNTFPSSQILTTIIFNDLGDQSEDNIIKEQVREFVSKTKQEPLEGDEKYIKESALEFCKKQSLKGALLDCVDLIRDAKYDQVTGIIKKAIERGNPKNFGHDYFNDVDKRHSEEEARQTIPTGWQLLDKGSILSGGLARGELGTIIGVAGTGKSLFLVHLGAHALKYGFNVLHYTLELSEVNIGIRYDACLTGISQNDAYNLKSAIKDVLPSMTNGALFIKGYPTKSANIQTLKNHIRLLESRNFKPDIIIVDYADLMRSTRGYEAKRFELESVYEELRALAQEYNVALWTCSQTNRSANNQEIIDLDMIGESWAKVQIADVVITFSRQRADKLKKAGKVYLAKNRIGKDGIILKARIDTEVCSISLLEPRENDPELLDNSEEGQEKLIKTTMRDKFENFKRDIGR
tara:strand:+ start:7848 stop:9260 length:1413 start_codon:yes stop_codon:yes gene_type:complete